MPKPVTALYIKRLPSNGTAVNTDRFKHYKIVYDRLATNPVKKKTRDRQQILYVKLTGKGVEGSLRSLFKILSLYMTEGTAIYRAG